MNAEQAKKISLKNQKKNKELQDYIKYCNNGIQKATQKGKRNSVLYHPHYLQEELIKHYEQKGYKIQRLHPPQTTLYITW